MSVETWKFINSFAPWFAALGTISAVFASLYLARRDKTIRLEVLAGHRLMAGPGMQQPLPEYLFIKIVNVGHREAEITNIGWKVGWFGWRWDFLKRRHAVQTTIEDQMSSKLPIRLRDGEEAKYFIRLETDNEWVNDFVGKILGRPLGLQLRTLRIQAYTSVGTIVQAPIEPSLRKKIRETVASH